MYGADKSSRGAEVSLEECGRRWEKHGDQSMLRQIKTRRKHRDYYAFDFPRSARDPRLGKSFSAPSLSVAAVDVLCGYSSMKAMLA